jgi:alkyl hydroperoxide reductase subunit AhpC
LAISVDSIFVHKIWNEEELSKLVEGGAPFPLVSDFGGRIGKLYGVYDEEYGINLRGSFIIDPDGILRGMEILSSTVGRNIVETIRQIHAFRIVRESQGKDVCPAGWEPGDPTLKPSQDLVGKVWKVWRPKIED